MIFYPFIKIKATIMSNIFVIIEMNIMKSITIA